MDKRNDAERLAADAGGPQTKEQRNLYAEMRARSLSLIRSMIEETRSPDADRVFARYCQVSGIFNDYSTANVLMILGQKPDACRVAGMRTWNRLGRKVKKGERALKIWAPVRRAPAEEQGEAPEEQQEGGQPRPERPRFRLVNVFDVSQTEGKPVSFQMDRLPEDPVDRAWCLLDGVAGERLVDLREQIRDPGWALYQQIAEEARRGLERRAREVEGAGLLADAVAYGVLHRYGLAAALPFVPTLNQDLFRDASDELALPQMQQILTLVREEIHRLVDSYDQALEAALELEPAPAVQARAQEKEEKAQPVSAEPPQPEPAPMEDFTMSLNF